MKVQFGSIITNGYGKIGGMFVKRLPSGHSLNVLPKTKSKSILQTMSSLTGQSYIFQAWKNISSGDKTLYSNIAASTPVTDKFGNSKFLTARQMFTRLNSRLINTTPSLIDVANYDTIVPAGTFSVLDIDFLDGDMDFNFIILSGSGYVAFRIDRLVDASVTERFINSRSLFLASCYTNTTYSLYSIFILKFPYAQLGQTYQVSFRLQNSYGVFGQVQVIKFILT